MCGGTLASFLRIILASSGLYAEMKGEKIDTTILETRR